MRRTNCPSSTCPCGTRSPTPQARPSKVGDFQWPEVPRDDQYETFGDAQILPGRRGSSGRCWGETWGIFARVNPLIRAPPRPADAHRKTLGDAGAELVGEAGDHEARKELDLGRPRRFVDLDDELALPQANGRHMNRYIPADCLLPATQDVGQDRRRFEAAGPQQVLDGRPNRQRRSRWSKVVVLRPHESTPSFKRTTRSGSAPGGRAPAVVSNAWPSGSSFTSERAVISSSSENASSRRRTGIDPVDTVTYRCVARRSARATQRWRPCESRVRASRPFPVMTSSSRWGPTVVTWRRRSSVRAAARRSEERR